MLYNDNDDIRSKGEERGAKRSDDHDALRPRDPISRLLDSTSSLLYSVVSYDDPSYFFLSPYPSPSLRHPTSRSPPSLFRHPMRSGRLQPIRFVVKELQRFFGGVDRERRLLQRRGSNATRVEGGGCDHEESKLQSSKERSQGKERRIVRTLRRVERRTCREGCNDSVEQRLRKRRDEDVVRRKDRCKRKKLKRERNDTLVIRPIEVWSISVEVNRVLVRSK